MARDIRYGLIVWLRDQASQGLAKLRKRVQAVGQATRTIGGGGIGGIFTGAASVAAGALRGLVGVARSVVGGIIGAFRTLVSAIARIFRAVVRTAAGILRGLIKTAAIIAAGIGAVIGWQLVKGIRENMRLADVRQVLRKLLGDAAKDAEQFARQLSLKTPFTPMQMLEATTGLAAVRADYRRFLTDLADWAAGALMPLEEIVRIFQRAQVGQFGEAMEGARRALISMRDLEREGARFTGANVFQGTPEQFVNALMAAVQRRFGGMAEQAAQVGTGPWSTFVGAIEELRVSLSEPWYERFNQGLIDLNNYLIELAKSDKWASIVRWSERVAEALDTRLRAAIEWLKAQDWGEIWAGFKEAVRALPGIVEESFGQILVVIRQALTLAKGYALRVVDEVAIYLHAQVHAELGDIAQTLRGMGMGQMEAAIAKGEVGAGEILKKGVIGGEEWMFRLLTKALGKMPPGAAAQLKVGEGLAGMADLIERLRMELSTRAEAAPAAAEAREAERAEAAAQLKEAAAALKDAARELVQPVAERLQPAPAAPPAERKPWEREPWAEFPAAALGEGGTPEEREQWSSFRRALELRQVQEMLRGKGFEGKAAQMQNRIDGLLQRAAGKTGQQVEHLQQLMESLANYSGEVIGVMQQAIGAIERTREAVNENRLAITDIRRSLLRMNRARA